EIRRLLRVMLAAKSDLSPTRWPLARTGSPSICSTLITSAPKSGKIPPQNGPETSEPSSSTRKPCRGPAWPAARRPLSVDCLDMRSAPRLARGFREAEVAPAFRLALQRARAGHEVGELFQAAGHGGEFHRRVRDDLVHIVERVVAGRHELH